MLPRLKAKAGRTSKKGGATVPRPSSNLPSLSSRKRKGQEVVPEAPPEVKDEEPEIAPEETPEPEPEPVIDPEEELQRRLELERQRKHEAEVHAICSCELEGLFKCAMETHRWSERRPKFCESRAFERLRSLFRGGFFTPNPPRETEDEPQKSQAPFKTILAPLHTLEVNRYLHFKSTSMLNDLSNVFGVQMTDQKLDDPNAMFSKMIANLHVGMEKYLAPYHPYDKIPFPFIVCVVGPQASGKTTVCQFIQKAFDVHVLECVWAPGDKKAGKMSRTSTCDQLETSGELEPLEFQLAGAIQIRYSDDKSAVSQITNVIKENLDQGKGFVICGYPSQKGQLANLEKAMVAAGASMQVQQAALLRLSARGRAAQSVINGIIFTLHTEQGRERLVDPETGCVYKKNFNMPSVADFVGVAPVAFAEARQKIESRLDTFFVSEVPVIAPKVMQQFNQFEAQIKKTMATVVIGTCESAFQMMQSVDAFMCDLYKRTVDLLPSETPIGTLMRPQMLVKPTSCFTAISTWYDCIEKYGSTIADQSNLVSTLASKLDLLMKAATERYQLLISKRDARLRLCREFMEKKTEDMSTHFKRIWDMSINLRDENIELIDHVIDKSGLIELLLEMRKSPKIVMIALVHRMLYVKWFADKFGYLLSDEKVEMESSRVLEPLVVDDMPEFNYELSAPPELSKQSSQETIGEPPKTPPLDFASVKPGKGRAGDSQTMRPEKPPRVPAPKPGSLTAKRDDESEEQGQHPMDFDYLMEHMKSLSDRPPGTVFFDVERACGDLGIELFEPKTITFEDTVEYANAFFAHAERCFADPILQGEARSSRAIFHKFTSLCHRKEASMVNSVFDLRNALTTFAQNKCTHEMETFSERFRMVKRGETLDRGVEPFEYDTKSVRPSIEGLADLVVSLGTPIAVQSLVSIETVFNLANEATKNGIQFSSDHDFLELAKNVVVDDVELEKLELCMRVMECVECFDIQKFLLCFSRSREDEQKLNRIYATKPAPPKLNATGVLRMSMINPAVAPNPAPEQVSSEQAKANEANEEEQKPKPSSDGIFETKCASLGASPQ